MARKRVVVVTLLVALLMGGSALVAQEAAVPALDRQVDARTLVPPGVGIYIEVNGLGQTWEAIKAGPLYEQLLDTGLGKQAQALAGALGMQFQLNVGAPPEEFVTKLLGRRAISASWHLDGEGVAAWLTEVSDPGFARKMLAAPEPSNVPQTEVAEQSHESYRGHTIHAKLQNMNENFIRVAGLALVAPRLRGLAPGTEGKTKTMYYVLCGNVLMASPSLPALKLLVDRFEDTPPESVLTDDSVQAALRALPEGYQFLFFVDLPRCLGALSVDRILDKAAANVEPAAARLLINHLLCLMKALQQCAMALYVKPSGVELWVHSTRDASRLTEEMRAILSQENVTPQALSHLSSDTLLFVSLPRITAQMKLIGEAVEQMLPAPPQSPEGITGVQPVQPLDLILGHNFTQEVLPGIGPEISLLVEASPLGPPAGEEGQAPLPLPLLPTATLFVQLSDDIRPEVERLIQTALGLAGTVTQQHGVTVMSIRVGDLSGYVIQSTKMKPPILRELLQPSIAFTDDFLVVATHPSALLRALGQHPGSAGEKSSTEQAKTLSGHVVALVNLKWALEAVELAQPTIMANLSQEGGTPEAVMAQVLVTNITEFLRPLAGQLTLTVQHTPAETNANLSLRTATPLLK